MTYTLNEPTVAAEEVDGEVIAINLSSGVYYSLVGWSAWAWNELTGGATSTDLARVLTEHGVADAAAHVDRFVSTLCDERLLVPGQAAHRAVLAPPDAPFDALHAERFTDMEDLILLDPVHDVDPTDGWPRATAPPG